MPAAITGIHLTKMEWVQAYLAHSGHHAQKGKSLHCPFRPCISDAERSEMSSSNPQHRKQRCFYLFFLADYDLLQARYGKRSIMGENSVLPLLSKTDLDANCLCPDALGRC